MAKKLKRPAKKIDQVDEIVPVIERVRQSFVENWRLFGVGFILLGTIVVVVMLWMASLERKENHASFLLSQGVTKLKEAEGVSGEEASAAYEEALKVLKDLVEGYGSTESGEVGVFYLGKVLSRLGRYGEAIQQYESFLSLDGNGQLYRSLALRSLGYAYQHEKAYDKAVKCFRELTQMEGSFLREESVLALARLYEAMGQKQEALDAYKNFLTEYPDSIESNRIVRKVALLEKQVR